MESQHDLKRQIGLRTATALIVGEIIAVGIFLTPAGMAKALGSPFWLLVVCRCGRALVLRRALFWRIGGQVSWRRAAVTPTCR